nr:MAG TPA: hypothetical protein [Caudoviricetes sp.]
MSALIRKSFFPKMLILVSDVNSNFFIFFILLNYCECTVSLFRLLNFVLYSPMKGEMLWKFLVHKSNC